MEHQSNQKHIETMQQTQPDQRRATNVIGSIVICRGAGVGMHGMIWQHPGFLKNVYYITDYRFFSVAPDSEQRSHL